MDINNLPQIDKINDPVHKVSGGGNTRVELIPITLSDTDMIVRWRNSNDVKKYFIYRDDITKESHELYFNNYVKTGKVKQFKILLKSSMEPIGCVYLRDIDTTNNKAEFGIFIGDSSKCGKGYGKEAAELICKYGFDSLGLHKISLRVLAYNIRAIKMYLDVGFRPEAFLRDELKLDGKYEDLILMSNINC